MRNIGKSIRGGALAIVLSLAMVISVFAGTGMEVRAEGGYTYQSCTSPSGLGWTRDELFERCGEDVFALSEKDAIERWLQTLSASDAFNDAIFIVCLAEGEANDLYAYSRLLGGRLGTLGVDSGVAADTIDDTVYIVKRSSTSGSVSNSASSTPHTHSYSWVTVQEVTADQDGIEEYRCSCGDVQARSVIPANMVFVKGLYGAIKDAPQNGTATFDSGRLCTISDYVIRKLAERPDVTTVITFEYQNQKYKMTIPAGVDYTSLLADEDYFYGYFYFANAVGATIETL